jgi:hypothetical protein
MTPLDWLRKGQRNCAAYSPEIAERSQVKLNYLLPLWQRGDRGGFGCGAERFSS